MQYSGVDTLPRDDQKPPRLSCEQQASPLAARSNKPKTGGNPDDNAIFVA